MLGAKESCFLASHCVSLGDCRQGSAMGSVPPLQAGLGNHSRALLLQLGLLHIAGLAALLL